MNTSRWIRAFSRLSITSPFVPAICMFVFGTGMFLIAVPLGLTSVDCPGGKHGGYVYEMNWFFNFMLVLPCTYYLAGVAVTSIGDTIKRLATERMFVDQSGRALTPDEALESWYELGGRVLPICAALGLIAMGQGIGEAWIHSLRPLHEHTLKGLDSEYTCAWSVAAVVNPGRVTPLLNGAFSFITYLGQGVAASFYLYMVSVVLAFSYWLDRFNRQPALPDLIPGLDSGDPRLGFEHLEGFVYNLFAASLGFTVSLFLIRIQFLYFGPGAKGTSVYSFIGNDVALGFFQGVKAIFSGDATLFSAGEHLALWSTVGAIAAFLLLVVVCLLVVSVVLRQAALRARDAFAVKRARFVALRPEMKPDAQDAIVRNMKIWPLRYPSLVNLLLIMAFSAAAFIAYRFTLIVLGAILLLAARRILAVFSNDKKSPAPAPVQTGAPSDG